MSFLNFWKGFSSDLWIPESWDDLICDILWSRSGNLQVNIARSFMSAPWSVTIDLEREKSPS